MISRRLHRKGFTIVELLIVIVIIGILATITIVAYNGVTRSASEASLKSDLSSAASQLGIAKVTNNDRYPSTPDDVKKSDTTTFQYSYDSLANTYCISAVSSNTSAEAFHYDSAVGKVESGVCSGHTPPGSGSEEPEWSQVTNSTLHACGIRSGTAYCWGYGSQGRLGTGNNTQVLVPTAVDATGVLAGKTVTAISAGGEHTCAIADGRAYCWGRDDNGQVGNTSISTYTSVPVAVDTSGVLAGKTVTAISATGSGTCAVADGEAFCWGYNAYGGVGNNSNTTATTPQAVDTSGVLAGKTVTSISTSGQHACAIADGDAYCWGYNNSGRLGNNSNVDSWVPVAVDTSGVLNGKTLISVDTGSSNCVNTTEALAYCWGYNNYGELGTNNQTTSWVPVAVYTGGVLGGKSISSVVTGGNDACAIGDARAYCWGNNEYGQVGNNATAMRVLAPTAVNTSGVLGGKNVTSISISGSFGCAVADGEIYCWGSGTYGRLGNGLATTSLLPVQVTNPS